jgi:hypothetical protein
MCRKFIYLSIVALVLCWVASTASAGVSYPNPPGGWTYIYTGDAAAGGGGSLFDALDGTWSHNNGSDSWAGDAIDGGTPPGGVSALSEGGVNFMRIQDCGNPTNHNMPDPSNRRIYLGHLTTSQTLTPLDSGVTLAFRARIPTTAPLDAQYPATGSDGENRTVAGGTPWPAGGNGYVNYSDGKGTFGIGQRSGGVKIISFCLALASDDPYTNELPSAGLVMNHLNGTAPTANVDIWGNEPGTMNILPIADPTVWHEFWIVIQADTSGGGTHRVTIYADGSVTPTVFHVTAGNGGEYSDPESYLTLGFGQSPQMGAIDVDFFAYKAGIVLPPGAPIKAWAPNPADGAVNVRPPTLQWKAGSTIIIAHDVYLGTDQAAIEDADTSSPEYQEATAGLEFIILTELEALKTYYWRVDGIEEDGTTHKGDVWRFTTPSEKAYNPTPANGATFVDPNIDLRWTAGFNAKPLWGQDVYLGTDATAVSNANTSTPVIYRGNQSTTTYDPGTMANNTAYYWRIDERNTDATTTKGNVWSFTTMPSITITDPDLLCWWKFDEGPIAIDWSGHNHHGTLEGNPQLVSGMVDGALEFGGDGDRVVDNAAAAYLNGLNAVTVCMWIKSDVIGTDKGFIDGEEPDGSDNVMTIRYDAAGSSFGGTNVAKMAVTSTSAEQQLESSSNIQTTEWQHVAMTWSNGGLIRFYINAVENTPSGRTNPNNTGPVSGCTKLIIGQGGKDAGGGWDGLIDDFRLYNYALSEAQLRRIISPPEAWVPRPADGATDVAQAVVFGWDPGKSAAKHNVYFGTDFDDVNNATTSTAGIYKGQQDANSYDPPGLLTLGETYYWRIDEVNGINLWRGDVWRFTIVNYLVVDDFESYTNTSPNIIWQTWIAGGGGKAGYSDPNYAELTIRHGGTQSMPLDYSNLNPPNYSEASRTFAATDFTKYGVKALSLWTRGYPPYMGSFVQAPAGTYTMTAGGTDIWDVPDLRHPSTFHDEFHYAYTQVSGNCIIIAKVESVSNTNAWAKAGVMVRDSLDDNSIHAMMCMTPGSGAAFQYRLDTGQASTNVQDPNVTTPYWVAIERQGSTFYGAYSPDGISWTTLGQMPITMTDPVCIGLALTSHNTAATCTAVFTNVSINQAPPSLTSHQDIGIKSNVAAPLYVTLQDSSQNTSTVTNPDPNAVLNPAWQEWDIPLSDFAGVYKNAITKLTVGVGTRSVTTGTIYVDDIRLYLPWCVPTLIKPLADFTNDCLVDYADLQIMVRDWLLTDSSMATSPPVDANMVVRYEFEDNLYDSASYAGYQNGDPCGAITYDTGTVGNRALSLGGGTCANFSNPTALDFGTTNWSVCAWIKTTQSGTGDANKGGIFGKGGDSTNGIRYALGVGEVTEGRVSLTTDDNVTKVQATSTTTINNNVWHQVVGLRDGDALRLYVNGLLEATTTLPAGYNLSGTSQHNAYVGTITNNSTGSVYKFYQGLIDDVRVYNYALSNAEIAYLATKGAAQIYIPLQSPANIYDAEPPNSKSVNLRDYALLADMWLEELLWPQ